MKISKKQYDSLPEKYKIWFEKGGDSSKGDVQKNIHPT